MTELEIQKTWFQSLTCAERKKVLHSLRSMVLRYRKAKQTTEKTLAIYAYEKGLTLEDVREIFHILEISGKV